MAGSSSYPYPHTYPYAYTYTYAHTYTYDGSAWATGDNTYGQLGDGTKTESLVFKVNNIALALTLTLTLAPTQILTLASTQTLTLTLTVTLILTLTLSLTPTRPSHSRPHVFKMVVSKDVSAVSVGRHYSMVR